MALKRLSKEQVASTTDIKGLLLNLDNGDLTALQQVMKQWNFKDEESALRFALAVIQQAQKGVVYIDRGDGAKVGLSPSDDLLKPKVK